MGHNGPRCTVAVMPSLIAAATSAAFPALVPAPAGGHTAWRRKWRWQNVAVAAVVGGITLGACGSSDSTDTKTSETDTPTGATDAAAANNAAAAEGAALGAAPSAALSWSGVDLDGNEVQGGSFAGQDTVLWFWAPWCDVCNEEAPAVSRIAKAYGDRIKFVGIAAHDTVGAMRAFVDKYDLPFVNVNDGEATIWAKLGVPGQPTAYFIDGETGVAVGPVIGVNAEGMELQIQALTN